AVGAQPRLGAGRAQPLGRMQLEHVVRMRGEERRAHGGDHETEDQHEPEERRAVAAEARHDEPDGAHTVRSRGATGVWATATRRFTRMKIAPAQTVKPITAL